MKHLNPSDSLHTVNGFTPSHYREMPTAHPVHAESRTGGGRFFDDSPPVQYPKRIEILDVPVDCVDMEQALAVVDSMVRGSKPQAVIAVNPEKVERARSDSALLDQIRKAGLLIPDGIGVVLAARMLRLGKFKRVPGSELMPAICQLAAQKGYSIFLLGASPEVNRKAAQVVQERFPGISIAGTCHGYIDDEEMPSVVNTINRSGAQILFVALGSPRQELWMGRYLDQLQVKVCQGVGGTFDVLAGRVRRAPKVFRWLQLEWLYRLLAQPKRILRQTALPKFTFQVLRMRILRSHSVHPHTVG